MFKKVFLLTFLVILLLNFSCANQQLMNFTARRISEDRVIFLKERKLQENYYLSEDKWYRGGERVKGDLLQIRAEDHFQFNQIQDFNYEITYPESNNFYITHVSALIEQSSLIGKAYIVDGGIGNMKLHKLIFLYI